MHKARPHLGVPLPAAPSGWRARGNANAVVRRFAAASERSAAQARALLAARPLLPWLGVLAVGALLITRAPWLTTGLPALWRWDQQHDGRTVWFGSATFDERVGLSHTTGQITHHIGPDVDAERDRLMREIQQTGGALETYYVDGFHPVLQGRNGGGDPWHTDGRLGVVVLKPALPAPPSSTSSPSQ